MSIPRWSLETRVVELPLRERFAIATETWDLAVSVLVILGHDGVTGVGEAQPAGRWGETTASVLDQLQTVDLIGL
ncbi:MAG: hypothetical protein ABR575_02415, partial [Actinomycetota bacterium]